MPFTAINQDAAAPAPGTTIGNPIQSFGDTLASMQAEMAADLFNRTDASVTRQTKWINWGYRNICNMLDQKRLWGSIPFNVTAGQFLYMLPLCVSWVKRVGLIDTVDFANTGGRELTLTDLDTFRKLPDTTAAFGAQTTNLWPECWFRFGPMLVIWPTPNTSFTLTVDFRVRPLDLVGANDCPILPPEFHESIFYAGMERAWNALGDQARAAQYGNMKLSTIRGLKDPDVEELAAMNPVLTPVRSYGELHTRSRG